MSCLLHIDASQSVLAHGTLNKAIQLTEELLLVHSKLNIKLDNRIYLSSIYIRCKQSTTNRRLMATLMVLPYTLTVYVCRAVLTGFTTEPVSHRTEAAMD